MFSLYYFPEKGLIEQKQEAKPDCPDGHVLIEVCAVNICGSDMHYYAHGCCGSYVIKEPLILGHEGSGRVARIGSGVDNGLEEGMKVFLNPFHYCGECPECMDHRENFCRNGIFLGTASVNPHRHGLLKQYITLPADQCEPAPETIPYENIACAEPLSVVLHGLNRFGNIKDKKIAVTGVGAIGSLMIMMARLRGASHITAIDINEYVKDKALEMGADTVSDGEDLPEDSFDVIFETTGVSMVLNGAIQSVKKGGTIVQIGTLTGELGICGQPIVGKEVTIAGSFRYTAEFKEACSLISSGELNLGPYITHKFSKDEVNKAFSTSINEKEKIKVSILLTS